MMFFSRKEYSFDLGDISDRSEPPNPLLIKLPFGYAPHIFAGRIDLLATKLFRGPVGSSRCDCDYATILNCKPEDLESLTDIGSLVIARCNQCRAPIQVPLSRELLVYSYNED